MFAHLEASADTEGSLDVVSTRITRPG